MKNVALMTLLVCGCLSQTVVEKYVCSDGWVVDSANMCGNHTLSCPKCERPTQDCPKPDCPTQESSCPKVTVTSTTLASPLDDYCTALGCPAGTRYVASKGSAKYHICACSFARRIKKENLVCYRSQEEALAAGKTACATCII